MDGLGEPGTEQDRDTVRLEQPADDEGLSLVTDPRELPELAVILRLMRGSAKRNDAPGHGRASPFMVRA